MRAEIKKELQDFFGLTFYESLGKRLEDIENKADTAARYSMASVVILIGIMLILLFKP